MPTGKRSLGIMRALIIDDEKKAREGIKLLLKKDAQIDLIGEAKDGKEAINKISSLKPDLIFLDIQMPGINGFDVLGSISNHDLPIVIFSTAYDQYALKAFEVSALDYLLKPFSQERFEKSLGRAKTSFANKQDPSIQEKLKNLLKEYQNEQNGNSLIHSEDNSDSRLIVKSNGKIHFLQVKDIYWIEAMDSYVKIHLSDQVHIVKSALKSIESKYKTFVQIHKSHLVNLEKIKYLESYFNGDFFVILENEIRVRGSRNFKNNLPKTL